MAESTSDKFLKRSLEEYLWLVSNKDGGKSFSDVVTKGLVVSAIVCRHTVSDVCVDVLSVDEEIFASVPGEFQWVLEVLGHIVKFLGVLDDSLTGIHIGSNASDCVTKLLDSVLDVT